MDKNIYFETTRTIVREWTSADLDDLAEGINSPTISRGFGTPYPYLRTDAEQYLCKVQAKRNSKGIYYAVEAKQDSSLLGGGGIYYKFGKYCIGLWLRDGKRQQGYGSEVVKRAVQYAFETMQVDALYGYYYEWNIGSKKLSANNGFVLHHTEPCEQDGQKWIKCCVILTRENYICCKLKSDLESRLQQNKSEV